MLLQKNEENHFENFEKNTADQDKRREKFNNDGLSIKDKLFHFMRTIT